MLEIVKEEQPCPFEKLHPSQLLRDDEFFMKLAFNQAIDAWNSDEVPVGAVIAHGEDTIAWALFQDRTGPGYFVEVGALDGDDVGDPVGLGVGELVGELVGDDVGDSVGAGLGAALGLLVGRSVGSDVGVSLGA